jgi:hypothetical protein
MKNTVQDQRGNKDKEVSADSHGRHQYMRYLKTDESYCGSRLKLTQKNYVGTDAKYN